MDYFDAVVLGIVEGLTEFLPISSTGHLTIAEKALGLDLADPAVTGYTAVIQMGADRRGDRLLLPATSGGSPAPGAWVWSSRSTAASSTTGWAGTSSSATIPVGIAGLLLKDLITGDLRSLWVVAVALIAWSGVMWAAERAARQDRSERDLGLRDAIAIGLTQVVALIPGVSRSGATISVGLFRGLDRVTATKLSFFLSIPALVGGRPLRAARRVRAATSRSGWPWSGSSSRSSSPTPRSPGCCGSSPGTPITWFIPYRVGLGAPAAGPARLRRDRADLTCRAVRASRTS